MHYRVAYTRETNQIRRAQKPCGCWDCWSRSCTAWVIQPPQSLQGRTASRASGTACRCLLSSFRTCLPLFLPGNGFYTSREAAAGNSWPSSSLLLKPRCSSPPCDEDLWEQIKRPRQVCQSNLFPPPSLFSVFSPLKPPGRLKDAASRHTGLPQSHFFPAVHALQHQEHSLEPVHLPLVKSCPRAAVVPTFPTTTLLGSPSSSSLYFGCKCTVKAQSLPQSTGGRVNRRTAHTCLYAHQCIQ